jgi:hypothetical protein
MNKKSIGMDGIPSSLKNQTGTSHTAKPYSKSYTNQLKIKPSPFA